MGGAGRRRRGRILAQGPLRVDKSPWIGAGKAVDRMWTAISTGAERAFCTGSKRSAQIPLLFRRLNPAWCCQPAPSGDGGPAHPAARPGCKAWRSRPSRIRGREGVPDTLPVIATMAVRWGSRPIISSSRMRRVVSAVEHRHLAVHRDQVEGAAFEQFEDFDPVGCGGDFAVELRQRAVASTWLRASSSSDEHLRPASSRGASRVSRGGPGAVGRFGGGACTGAPDREPEKFDPSPGVLSTPISPPIRSTGCWQIARPSPVPPKRLAYGLVGLGEGVNSRGSTAGSIPMPLSRTLKWKNDSGVSSLPSRYR